MIFWKYMLVFLSVATADGCWTRYMQSVTRHRAIEAAVWSGCIVAVGSISIISYVENPMYLIPACLGAFLGTYISVKTTPEDLK